MIFVSITIGLALLTLAGLVLLLGLELRRERRDVEADRARLARALYVTARGPEDVG